MTHPVCHDSSPHKNTSCAMGWLRLVGSLKLQVSFAEYSLFYRALLQKRPRILRSLLIIATLYRIPVCHDKRDVSSCRVTHMKGSWHTSGWVMALSFANEMYSCAPWLIQKCAMALSHVWHDTRLRLFCKRDETLQKSSEWVLDSLLNHVSFAKETYFCGTLFHKILIYLS